MLIHLVEAQSDMTEGRGRMVFVTAFVHRPDAVAFMKGKCGIMGRRPIDGDWDSPEGKNMGDWAIKTIEAREVPYDEKEELKKQALAKLSKEEKEVLGLII